MRWDVPVRWGVPVRWSVPVRSDPPGPDFLFLWCLRNEVTLTSVSFRQPGAPRGRELGVLGW